MRNRNYYLSRKSVLDAMTDHDRAMVLHVHLRNLEDEIQWIKDGSRRTKEELEATHARRGFFFRSHDTISRTRDIDLM